MLLIDSKGVPHKSGPDPCNGSRLDLCGTPLLSISNKVCDSVLPYHRPPAMRALAYPLLRLLEPSFLRLARLRNRWPPTFVVGAERSGTTLVCLHLAGRYRFGWIPLAAKRRAKHPLTATWRALGQSEWEPNLENRYGVGSGDLAPSDGWDSLRPWFREDGTAADPELRGFVNLVRGCERLFGAPFLNKNNANSVRVAALARAFPTALFVHVTRERSAAVASLVEARAKHGVALGQWWGAVPPDFAGRAFESELEQSLATHLGVELAARRALEALPPERWIELDYGDFCADPARLEAWLEAAHRAAGRPLERRAPEPGPARYEASRLPEGRRRELAALLAPLEERLLRSGAAGASTGARGASA